MPATKPQFHFWRFFFSPFGRVSRLAIWTFVLPVRLASLAIVITMQAIGFPIDDIDNLSSTPWFMLSMTNGSIVLMTMWPTYVMLTKRLHDIGWTGLPALIVFTPLVSGMFAFLSLKLSDGFPQASSMLGDVPPILNNLPSFLAIILACVPSEKGKNRFGPPVTGPADDEAKHF